MLSSSHYEIDKQNNFSSSLIVKLNTLSPDKLYFTSDSFIDLPKLIEFEDKKKTCHYHKDFNNSIYMFFRNFDIHNSKYLLPLFSCQQFRCMSCNKLHNLKTTKCCDMINSPLEIIKAKLIKVIIPENHMVNQAIKHNREEFLKLHFPDLTDMIIMR